MPLQDLELWKLFADGNPEAGPDAIRGFQSREETDALVVEDYTRCRLAGEVFPPIVVYSDGVTHWVAGGYHRILAEVGAALAEGKDPRKRTIRAEVRLGTGRDARLAAAGENRKHGKQRTNADKRKAVGFLLEDPEWSAWKNRQIAQHCGVSHALVNDMRAERESGGSGFQPSPKSHKSKLFRNMNPQEQAAAQEQTKCPTCGQPVPT